MKVSLISGHYGCSSIATTFLSAVLDNGTSLTQKTCGTLTVNSPAKINESPCQLLITFPLDVLELCLDYTVLRHYRHVPALGLLSTYTFGSSLSSYIVSQSVLSFLPG